MELFKKGFTALALVLTVGLISAGCVGGGNETEDKFADALRALNEDWELYEVKTRGDKTIMMIEVLDNVTFKEGQAAMKEVLTIDPNYNGMLEFYNSEVGMTLRKVEVFPGAI